MKSRVKYLLLLLAACSSSSTPEPATRIPSIMTVGQYGDPTIDHVRSIAGPPWMGQQRAEFCAQGAVNVIFDCNSPNEPFMGVIDCKAPFLLRDACLQFEYSEARWHLEINLIAMYAHAPSLAAALATQGVVVAGLAPRDGAVDQCEVCKRDHAETDCYRAVVNDPHNKLLWFIPCVGPARSEPQ